MSSDFLGDRRRALEDSFFRESNEQLLEQMRSELAERDKKDALSAVSGIKDDAVLSNLLSVDINSESLAGLSLVPLVAVAWADGIIQKEERVAILEAANREGMHPEMPCRKLLESWLDEQPGEELYSAWRTYVGALSKELAPEAMKKLKDDILGRALHVAEAAGGILGIGSVCKAEKKVLADLETAFN